MTKCYFSHDWHAVNSFEYPVNHPDKRIEFLRGIMICTTIVSLFACAVFTASIGPISLWILVIAPVSMLIFFSTFVTYEDKYCLDCGKAVFNFSKREQKIKYKEEKNNSEEIHRKSLIDKFSGKFKSERLEFLDKFIEDSK